MRKTAPIEVISDGKTSHETVYEYLDDLRDSGVTNMWGAAPYIQQRFSIPTHEASKLLTDWIGSFS